MLNDWPGPQKKQKGWTGSFPYTIAAFITALLVFGWVSGNERYLSDILNEVLRFSTRIIG